jgi:hypothetical protein
MLIYGFDDRRKPLRDMIAAFETLARTRVTLGGRYEAPIGPQQILGRLACRRRVACLIHPFCASRRLRTRATI